MSKEIDSALGRRSTAVTRRAFIRGAGALIALPAFATRGVSRAFAADVAAKASTITGAPLRSAFVYFPNGAIPSAWRPEGDGKDFQFKKTLQPLEPLKNMVQVMRGLDHKTAEGGPTAPAITRAAAERSLPEFASTKAPSRFAPGYRLIN